MFAEASTVLRAVAEDFFFNCWYLEIPSDNCIRHIPRCVHYHATVFGTYQGASTIMRKPFHWKCSRISMLEVETVPQSCIPLSPDLFEYCFIYEKFVTCREF
jgi:hypothetical protein